MENNLCIYFISYSRMYSGCYYEGSARSGVARGIKVLIRKNAPVSKQCLVEGAEEE